jgi:hypothetical protein
MLRGQIQQAQLDHGIASPRTGKPYTRQWVWDRCKEFEVETRGKKGPARIRTDAFVAQQTRERVASWYKQMASTEEGREKLRARQREKDRRRAAQRREAAQGAAS